ncbi:armadillo repeat-containing protein 7 isoform X2 [Mesoplodon densirostris]|uniref:armadillo repeat-containing protein 7 isoform X2 n=1 Tax=Mesoplodon densirostris TaxID=48708 RepID=UPI0028DBA5D2|nr:armadillo repeat-containing protein 7 isoform X2 [Mesoplodon densirostris]
MAQKPKVDPHVGRLGYLQALVTEFQATESQDAKEQVLANLANFAYDPSNYQYLRQLQVLDLFLDSLSEENETLVEFAIEHSSGHAGSAAMAHGPSRSTACRIFQDRGTNPCPLHRQADSQPVRHQGSPEEFLNSLRYMYINITST